MLYVSNYTAEEWAEKHGIEIIDMTCAHCGKSFKTTVPIITKKYVGLEMSEHGCPRNFLGATFTPRSEEVRAAWANILIDNGE